MGKSSFVNAANWQGAYDATQYLIKLGHQRIGFIAGLEGLASASDRLAGYRAALTDHGLPLSSALISRGDFQEEGGYDAAQKLLALPQRPTAILAANDLSAFGAIEAIREQGLRIPEDISIMGFDNIPQALQEMGQMGVKMLLERIQHPERETYQVTLNTQLVVRDSCQSPRP